jgi:hypothetical protein
VTGKAQIEWTAQSPSIKHTEARASSARAFAKTQKPLTHAILVFPNARLVAPTLSTHTTIGDRIAFRSDRLQLGANVRDWRSIWQSRAADVALFPLLSIPAVQRRISGCTVFGLSLGALVTEVRAPSY